MICFRNAFSPSQRPLEAKSATKFGTSVFCLGSLKAILERPQISLRLSSPVVGWRYAEGITRKSTILFIRACTTKQKKLAHPVPWLACAGFTLSERVSHALILKRATLIKSSLKFLWPRWTQKYIVSNNLLPSAQYRLTTSARWYSQSTKFLAAISPNRDYLRNPGPHEWSVALISQRSRTTQLHRNPHPLPPHNLLLLT